MVTLTPEQVETGVIGATCIMLTLTVTLLILCIRINIRTRKQAKELEVLKRKTSKI